MNVIDSLVLELSLDPSKFTRGQRDAVDSLRKFEDQAHRSGTAIEAQSKKSLELFSVLKRELLGVLGIAFGGVEAKRFLNFVTGLDASTGRLARTLGESTSELSAWQGAIQQIGGSAESANAALSGLSGEMSRFQLTGQSSILPVLSRLGISLYDQNHNLKTASQLWLELADAVHGMDPRQATAFLQMIPGANQDMINLLLQGRAAVETYLAAARAAGGTTAQSAAAAAEYQQKLALLDRSATDLGRTIANWLMPTLTKLLDQLRHPISLGAPEGHSLWDFLRGDPRARPHIIPGSPLDVIRHGLSGDYGNDYSGFFSDLWNGRSGDTTMRAEGIAKLKAAFAAHAGAGGLASNWTNFLSGLSFLETSQTGAPNAGSTARGYFQFLGGTAATARGAGIADPRVGSYDQQATATQQYIRRFHPDAAAAIDRGDYATAITILRSEWPSLPGGSQPQSASRYATFAEELRGGGPRPPASGGGVTIGSVNVYTDKHTAEGISGDIDRSLKRSLTAGAANYGPQ